MSATELLPINIRRSIPYGGLIASFFGRRLKVQKGQRVLVYGASGAIATSAVQLIKHLGAEDAFPRTKKSDLLVLKELAESGALRQVIDRRYTLDEIVDANRYVDLGHKKGNVSVTTSPR